jgi:hypothetical protein
MELAVRFQAKHQQQHTAGQLLRHQAARLSNRLQHPTVARKLCKNMDVNSSISSR